MVLVLAKYGDAFWRAPLESGVSTTQLGTAVPITSDSRSVLGVIPPTSLFICFFSAVATAGGSTGEGDEANGAVLLVLVEFL